MPLESKLGKGVIIIVHTNGDQHDITDRHNGLSGFYRNFSTEYKAFLKGLKEKIKQAHGEGATMIYVPLLNDLYPAELEPYFTKSSDYNRRHQELRKDFPFLDGLDDIQFTVLPDGSLGGSPNTSEIDAIIEEKNPGQIIVGGKFKQVCVALKARDIKARHPSIPVYIGDDISFRTNSIPPIEGYDSIPQATLRQSLVQ